MSNILIIKHGSLGDLIQANGAIKDIKNKFPTIKFYYSRLHITLSLCIHAHILTEY